MNLFISRAPGDRIIAPANTALAQPAATHVTLEQFKRSIARDLEALLNTRIGFRDDELEGYPHCVNSIVNYGLPDFAHLCLSDSGDRKEIYDCLRTAIERHEPRLSDVQAQLVTEVGAIRQIEFVASGRLRSITKGEHARFDLVLVPSSLRYAVR